MTRISGLLVATGLAILPIGAFAQQTAAPAATPTEQPATQAAPATTTETKAPVKTPAAKTHVVTKHTRTTHVRHTTTTPAAKPAVPSNS
jgi:hypothetical protein